MNRYTVSRGENIVHVPRRRGDEPAGAEWPRSAYSCSPQARRLTVDLARQSIGDLMFPVHTGMKLVLV